MNENTTKIEPAFNFGTNESSFLLYEGLASVTVKDELYEGQGKVDLELFPQAGIYFQGSFNDFLSNFDESSFSIGGSSLEGSPIKIRRESDKTIVKWCPKSEPVNFTGNESTQISRIVFHLFNFVNFWDTKPFNETRGGVSIALHHIDLNCGTWNVGIQSLFETNDNFKALKEEGGYRLTHVGCFEKNDGSSFSGKEANEYLNALRHFLSFAKGCWCEPLCVVGFDTSNNRVWESWSSPRETWLYPMSWFDPHHSTQLMTLFPGFMKRWTNSDWRQSLQEVIYWYLNANNPSRGIDAGIILTQAALERLSYEFSVQEKKLLTDKGFKDLWASDKFRLMFSSLNIPLEAPDATANLQKLSKKFNWLDAPHALTEIRNSLVHPEHSRRGQVTNGYFDAWNLGLWYLEMSILAICGYSGNYGNRLEHSRWLGRVESVPWELT